VTASRIDQLLAAAHAETGQSEKALLDELSRPLRL